MKYTTIAFAMLLFTEFALSGCYTAYVHHSHSYLPPPTPNEGYTPPPEPNEKYHRLRNQIPGYAPAPPTTRHPSTGHQSPAIGQTVPSYTPPPDIVQRTPNPASQNLRNNMGNRNTPPVRSPNSAPRSTPPPRKTPASSPIR